MPSRSCLRILVSSLFTLTVFAVSATRAFSVTPSLFMTPYTFATGAQPIAVAVGDFNGDGKMDVAVANQGGKNVSVLLGTGDGHFLPAVNYPSPTGASTIAVADVNGDSKLDVMVASGSNAGHQVNVLMGNGDGTFQAAVSYALPENAFGIVAADFNGDGKPDLAVAGWSGTGAGVMILQNKGDGTFRTAVNVTTGFRAQAVATGDFDNDGNLDLIVANSSGTSASLLLGRGDGTFQAAISVAAGPSQNGIAVGDFNGDGNLDFAVSGQNGNPYVEVVLGNGDSTFQAGVSYTTGTNSANALELVSVTSADLNGDGKRELIATNNQNDDIGVLFGKGDGTFKTVVNYRAGRGPGQIATGDFNGDSIPDLLIADTDEAKISVLLGNNGGSLQAARDFGVSSSLLDSAPMLFADFSNDGKADLVVGGSIMLSNGDGTFQPSKLSGTAGATSLAAADLNKDGKLDLIAGFSTSIKVLLGKGNGTFQPAVSYTVTGPITSLVVADLSGDGKLDVAGSSSSANNVSVLLGNGDGTLQTAVTYSVNHFPQVVLAADLNGDGKLDLLTMGANGGPEPSSILLGHGDGTFAPGVTSGAGGGASAVLKDFNGDGKLDLALAGASNTVEIDFGNGDGTFTFGANYTVPAGGPSLVSADFNHDGKADLAAVNENSSNVSVLFGKGDGTFQNPVNYATSMAVTAATADVNGDGAPDLAVADERGNGTVAILLNERGDAAALSSSKNPSSSGQSVIFTANVTVTVKGSVQRNGALTGTVTFKDGSTVLGTGAVAQGKATFATSSLASGIHNITASYSGNANYNPVTSATLVQTVNP